MWRKEEIRLIAESAKSRKEGINFIKKNYEEAEAVEFFKKVWAEKGDEQNLSLRNLKQKELKEKVKMLFEIAELKKKKLYVYLVVSQKKVPMPIYKFMIQKTTPARERLRGKKVRIVDVLDVFIFCVIENEMYKFTMLDINQSKLAEIR